MNSNDMAVCQATYRLLGNGYDDGVPADVVCATLGKPPGDPQTLRSLARLYDDDYIGGYTTDTSPGPIFIKPTRTGRREGAAIRG